MAWADYCRSRKKGTEQCIRDKDGRIVSVLWNLVQAYGVPTAKKMCREI